MTGEPTPMTEPMCACGVKTRKACNDGPNMWCAAGTPADQRSHSIASAPSLAAENARLREEVERLRADKDVAYYERNRLVAALARLFPSGTKSTAIEGWNPEWHGCVYIDGPGGQMSWHFHDSHAWLFKDLPPYQGEWDGHTTEWKYERLHMVGEAARAALAKEEPKG